MKSETRNCQSCKQKFILEPEDFAFYEVMQVPPPTHCRECRFQRRLAIRNERTLYKRSCDMCKESIFSVYSPDKSFPVYCVSCYQSDKWDPLSYGKSYDFSKTFFSQFMELQGRVPRANLWHKNSVNSRYANFVQDVKNVYLSYSVIYECENVFYSKNIDCCSNIFDCTDMSRSEACYDCVACEKCFDCVCVNFSRNCMSSYFLYDCVGCTSCFLCTNLRNKSHCILNKQYTKEEYEEKMKAYGSLNSEVYQKLREEFFGLVRNAVHRYARIINSVNVSGDDLRDMKNARYVFNAYSMENAAYAFRSVFSKDVMDVLNCGKNELVYEFSSGGADQSRMLRFVFNLGTNLSDVTYCESVASSSNLFGCVGMKSNSYCVLNKQYKKEEYEDLLKKIIQQMDEMPYESRSGAVYRFGEFFPPEASPFSYNETIAQEYFSLDEAGALALGYSWKKSEEKAYLEAVDPSRVSPSTADMSDDVLSMTFLCKHKGECREQCTTNFRLHPEEFAYYRKLGLGLPGLCPNCRHYERLKRKNPIRLYKHKCDCGMQKSNIPPSHKATDGHRKNQNFGVPAEQIYKNITKHFHGEGPCSNEFETSYSPDRPESVYCEACYQAEVS